MNHLRDSEIQKLLCLLVVIGFFLLSGRYRRHLAPAASRLQGGGGFIAASLCRFQEPIITYPLPLINIWTAPFTAFDGTTDGDPLKDGNPVHTSWK